MKAPDKIYVPQYNIEAGSIQELDELIVADSTEYIRKDTLLEWLVQRNKEINRETMALWRSLEIRELYDKINSL